LVTSSDIRARIIIFVLSSTAAVRTEFYDPVLLRPGQRIYIDSSMGHAYPAAEDCHEAEVLAVMSSPHKELMTALLTMPGEQREAGG
jgi:hypothetical protein